MELQLSEAIVVAVTVAVLPLIIATSRRLGDFGGRRWVLFGYLCVLAADTFTILEGVGGAVGEWLNLAEHASLMAAGVAFCLAVSRARMAHVAESHIQ